MFIMLLVLTSSRSFSMSEKEFEEEYKKINKDLNEKIDICLKQYHDIVLKPIKHFDKAIRKDEYVEFVKDEKEVLFYLDNLYISNFTADKEYRYLDLIVKNCNEKNLETYAQLEKNRKSCLHIFDEYSFMRGLIYGIKNHGWSEKIKEKAKRKIFDYIKFYAKTDAVQIIVPLISLNLLEEMLDYDLIDKKYKKKILEANNKGNSNIDLVKKGLKKKLTQKSPDLCNNFKENISRETKFAKETSKELKVLLEEI